MKDAVIITSGGMDSTTMLYEYKDEIAMAITFDYGSTQNGRERRCAIMHCQRLGIKHLIIPLDFMHKYFKSALLESADAQTNPTGPESGDKRINRGGAFFNTEVGHRVWFRNQGYANQTASGVGFRLAL